MSNSAKDWTIGGAATAGNLISGNSAFGILISGTQGGTIQGNLVGTNLAGTARIPNSGGGIELTTSGQFMVGGATGSLGNLISGNTGPGITLSGSSFDSVQGNLIGLGVDRTEHLPNQIGLLAENGGTGDSIGPPPGGAGAPNVIAANNGYGVVLGNSAGDPVMVSINRDSFFANHSGSIQMTGFPQALPKSGMPQTDCTEGPAPAGPGTTPNDILPCPLMYGAASNSATGKTRITGEACTGCLVEVYQAPNGADDEGKVLLGTVRAGSCPSPMPFPASVFCTSFSPWVFNVPAGTVKAGRDFVVATATSPLSPYETSTFSRDVPVGKELPVNTAADLRPPCAPAAYSLRCAITDANADKAGDEIEFSIPSRNAGCAAATVQSKAVHVCTITPASALPAVSSASTFIDGYSPQSGAASAGHRPAHAFTASNRSRGRDTAFADSAIIVVALDGKNAGSAADGIRLEGPFDSAAGLAIQHFGHIGLLISGRQAADDILWGSFIGVTPTGSAAGNGNGVEIRSGARMATVGGRAAGALNLVRATRPTASWPTGRAPVRSAATRSATTTSVSDRRVRWAMGTTAYSSTAPTATLWAVRGRARAM